MKFSRDYALHEVVSKEPSAVALRHINIVPASAHSPHGAHAVGCDGFILVAVPVTLEEDDYPGLLRADIWQAAIKVAKAAKTPEVTMRLGADTVMLADTSIHPRFYTDVSNVEYPDMVSVIPTQREAIAGNMALSKSHMDALYKALGVKLINFVRLTNPRNYPIFLAEPILDAQPPLEGALATPPLGLIQPLYLRADKP